MRIRQPPMIIPVIHYADGTQAMRNAEHAHDAGCDGVLLIHMEGRDSLLVPSASAIKRRWPAMLVGVNHLSMDPIDSLAAGIAAGLNMTWTDEQVTHSAEAPWSEARALSDMLATAPGHLMFAGVAFKHQRHEPDTALAARTAVSLGFVPTTSGPATGVAADAGRVARLRDSIGDDAPLAIASGVTPENVRDFAPHLTHMLVATGVSADFHELDPARLDAMRRACSAG